jgi:hypothetical protein
MIIDITSEPPTQAQIDQQLAKENFAKNAFLFLALLQVLALIVFGWLLNIPVLDAIQKFIFSPLGWDETSTQCLAINSLLCVIILPIAIAACVHAPNIQKLSPGSDAYHAVLEPYLSMQPVKSYLNKVNQQSRRLTNAEIEKIETYAKDLSREASVKSLMDRIYKE